MSGAPWQDVAVGLIVAGALAWLVARRVRAARRPTPFCENCPGYRATKAGVRPAPAPDVLLSIGEAPHRRGGPRGT